jgi:hypothetical protein
MSELKLRPPEENANPRRWHKAAPTSEEGTIYRAPTGGATFRVQELGEEDLGFDFDVEESVEAVEVGGAELLETSRKLD